MVNNIRRNRGLFLHLMPLQRWGEGGKGGTQVPHTGWGVPVPMGRHQGQLCTPARMEEPGKHQRGGAEGFIAGENASLGPCHVPPATSTELCSAGVSRMTFPRQTLESHY